MHDSGKEWFIEAPWGKIGVIAWGDSTNPPVLMVHGRQDSAATFTLLVKHLPKSFYYVAIDLPGNGKSEHLPKGMPLTTYDFVAVVKKVVQHFRWQKFVYMGHSLGTVIGKYFMLAYPGLVARVVDLDPIPAYDSYEVNEFPKWFEKFYDHFYEERNYKKYNVRLETAPKITYQQAFETQKQLRGLTQEATELVIERNLENLGDGYFRYVFDQRMKNVMRPALPSKFIQRLYESLRTPTLIVLPTLMVLSGAYNSVPYIFEERELIEVRIVESNHDLHLNAPDVVGMFVSDFLLDDSYERVKSKL